jgi:hypothetical protein
MRKWFKYALVFLVLCAVLSFFIRERFTPTSIPPERPVKMLPPYGNIIYTEDGSS